MKAGQLRHRLQIQSPVESRDDAGQTENVWQPSATVWGSIEPMKGSQLAQAQQLVPLVTHKITIRGKQPLASSNRILFQPPSAPARTFSIEWVGNLQERGITTVAYAIEARA